MSTTLETLAVNTIRTLSIDAINQANSGHPGLPMGAAPMAYALWANHLNHNPRTPNGLIVIALFYLPVMVQACYIACFILLAMM